ncbi:hypothetical protein HMI56_006567 [Coelomomyces lativittatus]|nr:hypothetical protein HMI56_006567 [Coelomomyces lativittatus]
MCSLHDLALFTKMASKQVRAELRERANVKPLLQSQKSNTSSWTSWLWASPNSTETDTSVGLENADLERILDYDQDLTLQEASLPQDCILYSVKWKTEISCLFLQNHSAAIPNFNPDSPYVPNTLSAIFHGFTASFQSKLNKDINLSVSVKDICALDALSSCNKEIIYTNIKESDAPLFSLKFSSGDTNQVAVNSQSVTILYTPQTELALSTFFTPPEQVFDSYKNISSTLKHQTRAGLEYTLSQHKATEIIIDAAAPVFLFPLGEEEALVLDSGHLYVNSQLLDTDAKKDFEGKAQMSEEEMKKLLSLMYDKYKVSLKNAKVVVGNSIQECLDVLKCRETTSSHIIDGLDLTFLLEISILPKALNITKMKMSGSLPELNFNLSDRKYKSIMTAIDLFTTNEEASSGKSLEPIVKESAKNTSLPDELSANQQDLIDFRFQVDKVRVKLSLFDTVMASERELALLTLDRLNVQFNQRKLDSRAQISLHSLHLKDLQQPIEALTPLIHSLEEAKELVLINYQQFESTSPEFTGFHQIVDLSFESVKILLNRKSILDFYDFLMTTFVSNNEVEKIAEDSIITVEAAPPKRQVKFHIKSILLDFNEEDTIFAQVSLGYSDFMVELDQDILAEGILGKVDITSSGEDLVSIQGEKSADFRYASGSKVNDDIFDSMLNFQAESMHLLYRPILISRILGFLSEFAAMHSVMEVARRRAAESAADKKFGFSFEIHSPIIEHNDNENRQLLGYLGELKAKNKYLSKDAANYVIDASLTHVKIDTVLQGKTEHVLDDIQLLVSMEGPQLSLDLSEVELHITREQYVFLLSVYYFLFPPNESNNKTPSQAPTAASQSEEHANSQLSSVSDVSSNLGTSEISMEINLKWPRLGLELLRETSSFVHFDLHGLFCKILMTTHGTMEGEFGLHQFAILDSRTNDNVFKDIIPLPPALNQRFAYQLLCRFTMRPSSTFVSLALDSPQFLVMFDFIQELSSFFSSEGIVKNDTPSPTTKTPFSSSLNKPIPEVPSKTRFRFQVKITNAQAILVHKAQNIQSNALVLGFSQLNLWHENSYSCQLDGLGIFICRMNDQKDKIRVLQDVNMNIAMEYNPFSYYLAQGLDAHVDPIIIRISYQEALFLQEIVQQYMNHFHPTTPSTSASNEFILSHSSVTSLGSTGQSSSLSHSTSTLSQMSVNPQVMATSESLKLHVQGVQLILIDDLHDLHVPMFDFNIEPFDLESLDWSSLLKFNVSVKFSLNMWNPKNSTWEPMIEPSSLDVDIKSGGKAKLNFSSKELMNINITRRMLETVYSTIHNWPTAYDTFHGHKRRPYVIRNRTGQKISIWDSSKTNNNNADLEDGEETPWHFEDWKASRESTQKVSRTLVVFIHGNAWETIELENLDKEKVTTYVLRPRIQDKVYRLCVDVKVEDKLKIITLKSNLIYFNTTLLAMDFYFNDRVVSVPPNGEFSVPLNDVYSAAVRIRPPADFGYLWSQAISWDSFSSNETLDLTCSSPSRAPMLHFIAHSTIKVSENSPTQTPASMTIAISSPIEIENALPFEINYQIHDRKNAPAIVSESVGPSKISSACASDISKTLGLQIKIPELNLTTKEVGLIPSRDEMKESVELDFVTFQNGLKLNLLIEPIPNTGYSRKVSIYSPFVILNRLSKPIILRDQLQITVPPMKMDLISDSNVTFSLPNSEWSKQIVFNTLAASSGLAISSLDQASEWHVGLSVTEECCRFGLSKLIIFDSRFILRNMTSKTLEWKQQGATDVGGTILPDTCAPLEWLLNTSNPNIVFRYAESSFKWSAPINVQVLGLNHARMDPISPQDPLVNKPLLLELEVVQHEASLFMHIKETDQWPFRIENLTQSELQFSQLKHNKERYAVSPGRSALYSWDDPTDLEKQLTVYYKDTTFGRNINLFEIGSLHPWDFIADGQKQIFAIDIHVDGTTRVLQLSNYQMGKSIYRLKSGGRQSTSGGHPTNTDPSFEVINVHSVIRTILSISLQLGISLNSDTEEIMYITLKDLVFNYQDTNLYTTYRLDVHWLQIDNQLFAANEPIVLFPVEISKSAPSQHHTFQMALVKSKDQSHGVHYYKYFTCLLQEMTFSVDQALLAALSNFFYWEASQALTPWEEKCKRSVPNPRDQADLMYFEAFQIQPIKMSVSFSASQSSEMSGNVFTFVTKILSMGFGNIHNLQLRLNSLTLEHPICTFPQLYDAIYKHYHSQVFGNVYKILGSADFLGNPAGLFNNLASGVQVMFYEPLQGIVSDRPQDLGIGLAKGTATFVGKAVYGFADGFARFTGAIGKGLATATLDEQFQQSRQISRTRNRPKHAIYGVTAGTKSFARGVLSGVTGVAMKPIEGAKVSGVGGFFKGVGKGIVGLAAKPMVGLLDMASNISEGIKNTTTVFDDETEIDRMRLPRFIDKSHTLAIYSAREALGQSWLKMLNNGAYASKSYVAHLELKLEDYACILTTDIILMIRLKQLRTEWELPIGDVRRVDILPQEKMIRIHIPNVQKNGFKIITGPDPTSIEWFGTQIDKVFKKYVYDTRPIE